MRVCSLPCKKYDKHVSYSSFSVLPSTEEPVVIDYGILELVILTNLVSLYPTPLSE